MAWFTAPSGATCVAAYDAVGASSLADSYVNEATPGTFNAAPGVAPTWAYGSGWTFNGSTQYLTTGGLVPDPTGAQTWSALVRFSGAVSGGGVYLFGAQNGGTRFFGISPNLGGPARVFYRNGGSLLIATTYLSGVLGFAGATAYRGGAAEAGAIGASGGTITREIYIGAQNDGSAASKFSGNIQALAVYSGTLTAADVLAITAAMNALPASAGLLPSMIQHAAMGWR